MSLPDIDFSRIRTHDGSRHGGFEELCSQLASLEDRPVGSTFVRKGRGGDAGVECYARLANGSERGWQAKYLFAWDDSLVSQLDKSLRTALDKHQRLTEFVVCLPFDLPDARPTKGKSAYQKWEVWKAKWEKAATAENRILEIFLWDKSAISSRLAADNADRAGRLYYWFGTEALTADWFTEQFGKTRAALGSRYTPETNVDLPIRKDFLAFVRDPSLGKLILDWELEISDAGNEALRALESARKKGRRPSQITAFSKALELLKQAFDCASIGPHEAFPLQRWSATASACHDKAQQALYWLYDLPPSEPNSFGIRAESWARDRLYSFTAFLDRVTESLGLDAWRLANARTVMLEGPAGVGKSHLLADIVEHQVHSGRPALMVLGSSLIEDEPWRQIITQLDLPPTLQVKHFLGALDAAAQAANVRAVLCVDAINERHGTDIWPERLASFLKMAEPFPRVAIVLSCRTTYIAHVVPADLDEQHLTRIEHHGFGGRGGDAANVYLSKRGIVRPGAPNLVPEFQNPLFLKTCCDFLEKEGKTELPRGLRGVSAIFGFYNGAVIRAVTKRMKLDPALSLIQTALDRFSDMLVKLGEGYASKPDVIATFEAVLPSGGRLERSLLTQFESEGVLAIELVPQPHGPPAEAVRFTFERFSDHAIAARLLREHLDPSDIRGAFAAGSALGERVFGEDSYRHAGIIEAIAIQLPEQAAVEILDVRDRANWTVREAFFESLLWREQIYFTDRTFELVQQHRNSDGVNDIVISIATEPANKFNARFVHSRLLRQKMPKRDAGWSIYLARHGEEGDAVETLIGWAMQNGMGSIEDERAELAAVMLGWFLSTSNRTIRDKATKALACLLATRLKLAVSTLKAFAKVDDLYIKERLFAAAYGAALQGRSVEGLRELAAITYKQVFASGSPPLNELLRDHARGIMAYARWRKRLPAKIDMTRLDPPYSSPWPIEYVPDALIASYKEDYGKGQFTDRIVGSTVEDGDFARYIIDHTADKWSPARLGTRKCPTTMDVALSWMKKFQKRGTSEQHTAFLALLAAAEALKGEHIYKDTPERDAFNAAETEFRSMLSDDAWEEYRSSAQSFVRHSMFAERHYDHTASFNRFWARRWVCKRAHDLGWTPELFSTFDRRASHDRRDHRVERVGKKYQWLALNDLVARMADNLAYLGGRPGASKLQPQPYRDANGLRLRDIDPSLLVTQTHYDGWKQWDRTWWVPVGPQLRPISPVERLAWLEGDSDVLNDAALIDVTDPRTKRRWLVLGGFASWRQHGIDGGRRELQRETWFRLSCLTVRKKDEAKLLRSLSQRTLVSDHDLPGVELDSSFWLGEYPWHPSLADADRWAKAGGWHKLAAPVRATVTEYLQETSGYDQSVDQTVNILLPAPWLATAMGLRFADGRQPVYLGEDGDVQFFDPSVVEPGHQAALVDRGAFLAMLERENLSAVWVIGGEKVAYGGREPSRGFGGLKYHTGVYSMTPTGFSRKMHFEYQKPSADQLEAFLAEAASN